MERSINVYVALQLIAHVLVSVGVSSFDGYTNANDNDLALSNSTFVLLGGVLPIHPAKADGTCGPVDRTILQRAEAIAFAVGKINSDPTLLPPGIKLAFGIRDSCLLVNTALDETLDFITGSIGIGQNATSYRVSGIIGETASTISIAMASLLRLFRIPQVSPYSTALELSGKTLYPYFLRIPPPDNYQSAALVDLVVYFNWTYIITINSGDTYGQDGINEFTKILKSRNGTIRCVAASIEISFPNPSQSEFDKAAVTFMDPLVVNASAVVLFGHYDIAVGLLDALKRHNVTRRLFWVGSDSWGDSLDGIYPNLVSNLVSVVPKTFPSEEFDRYFESLNIYNHTSNPWFAEFWQSAFNCTLNSNNSNLTPCNVANQRISPQIGYVQDSFVPLTIDAVYAFAYSIRNLHMNMCNGSGLCKAILSTGDAQSHLFIPGNLLLPYLFNVTFPSQSGVNFTFDKNGDPTRAVYTIKNLQFQNGNFMYVPVGTWNNANVSSPLNFTRPVVWNNYEGSIVSRCSDSCSPGQYRLSSSPCCWKCVDCPGGKDYSDGTSCSQCAESTKPNQFRNACITIQASYYHISDPGAIVILIIACLGILATISVIVVFIIHFNHKIIKATSRELTIFLLAGVLLSYVVPFLYVIKPSAVICGTRWIGVGFSFSISFSALLVRTIRIHRIFNRPLTTKKPLFLGSVSQAVITLMLIGVQVVIMGVWLIVERPGARYTYGPTTGEVLCSQSAYSAISVTVGYNFLLLILTTYFAFRTRRVPKNFNETRYINVTVYSLVIIWVVLLPTYFGTASLGAFYQTTSLLLTIVLSASVVLRAIFVSRLVYLFRNMYRRMPLTETTAQFNTCANIQSHIITNGGVCDELENGSFRSDRINCDASTQTEEIENLMPKVLCLY